MYRLCLMIGLSLGLLGCSGPCDRLAESACEHAGEDSEHCAWIQERASRASPEDRRACQVALDLVTELEKVR